MNFFSQAKANFGYAKYLTTCHNVKARNALIKLRLSAHNLPVEVAAQGANFLFQKIQIHKLPRPLTALAGVKIIVQRPGIYVNHYWET